MLYEPYETEISKNILGNVLTAVTNPPCLLGGWAVYDLVNQRFNNDIGHDYVGSRDIDLGFHLEAGASQKQLKQSDFAQAMRNLESQDFELVGYRLLKYFDVETRKEVDREQAKSKPVHEMFEMYVDLIVDNVPQSFQDALGFTPID